MLRERRLQFSHSLSILAYSDREWVWMVVSAVVVPQNEMCKTFRLILLICHVSINAKSKLSVAFKMMGYEAYICW